MRPILFEWGLLVIPSFGLLLGVGFLVGSFVLWRRLRSEYDEEDLLTLSLFLALSGLLGGRLIAIVADMGRFGVDPVRWLSLVKVPGLSLYGGVIGMILGTWIYVRRANWRFWEVLDAVVEAGIWLMMISSVGVFLSGSAVGRESKLPWGVEVLGMAGKRHPVAVYYLLFGVLLIIVLGILRKFYRRFSWYPSGRVGFVGLSGLFLFLVGSFVLESLTEGGIHLLGLKVEQIISLFVVLWSAVCLYSISGRTIRQDKISIEKSFRAKFVTFKQKLRR